MRKCFILPCLIFLLALLTQAGLVQAAKQGTSTLAALQKKAEQGDANAQLDLGVMYAEGQSVAQDYVKAEQWLQKAARQGNRRAQTMLGELVLIKAGEEGRKAAEARSKQVKTLLSG